MWERQLALLRIPLALQFLFAANENAFKTSHLDIKASIKNEKEQNPRVYWSMKEKCVFNICIEKHCRLQLAPHMFSIDNSESMSDGSGVKIDTGWYRRVYHRQLCCHPVFLPWSSTTGPPALPFLCISYPEISYWAWISRAPCSQAGLSPLLGHKTLSSCQDFKVPVKVP